MNARQAIESSMQRQIVQLIDYFEQRPQINSVGIRDKLEEIVIPDGKDPAKLTVRLPQIYHDLRDYYNKTNQAVEKGEMFHNSAGAKQFLNKLKQKYF